jgi:hypothetical protein
MVGYDSLKDVQRKTGLDWWFAECGIDWESRTTRNNIVKRIEDLLREKFG